MIVFIVLLLVQNTTQAPPRDPRAASASGSAIIRGVVVDEPTGAPIAGARVNVTTRPDTLNPLRSPAFSAEVSTSDDGRFEFTGLPAGEVVVSANPGEFRASHLLTILGHEGTGAFLWSPSLELAPGEVKSNVRIALPRAAAIEGRVVNEYGEPMSDVTVMARVDGRVGPGGRSASDDRGRFRLYGLAPGRYLVCATPERGWEMGPRATEGDGLDARYDQTCVSSPVVTTAAETPMVQIQVQRVGAFTLSGTVVSSTGADVSNVHVSVARIDAEGNGGTVQSETRNGQFVARGLIPGDYAIFARFGPAGGRDYDDVREGALMSVRIDAADVTNLAITTVPVASVSGRVVRDPRASSPLPSRVTPRMLPPLDRLRFGFSPPPPTTLNPDGTFTIKQIIGTQVIDVHDLPDGWFVSAVRHGDEDITGQSREFRAGDDRPLLVYLSDRSATLRARAVGEDGKPRSDAQVILVPADPKRWNAPPFFHLPARDKEGFTRIANRAPGDYFVAAIPMWDAFRLPRLAGTLEPIARAGRRITLVEGETLTLDVPVTVIEDRR